MKRRPRISPQVIRKIEELVAQGLSDTAIAGKLGIHRTTVKRHREEAGKRDLARGARAEVVRQALTRHFEDLLGIVDRLRSELRTPDPDLAGLVDSLHASAVVTLSHIGMGPAICLRALQDGTVQLGIPAEGETLFACLRQHTKGFEVWRLTEEWEQKGGQYFLSMSDFYGEVKRRAEESTGLRVRGLGETEGISREFAWVVYDDAWRHAFLNARGWEGVEHEVIDLKPGWYALRLGGTTVAWSGDREVIDRCLKIQDDLMKEYRAPQRRPPGLARGLDLWRGLKELEVRIQAELEKMALKRTFPGRCEVCPD